MDSAFSDHFNGRLKQVFLYITDRCNIACEQCIYKPNITYSEKREIPLPVAQNLLETFFSMGARKVTFLGGEPTLYDLESNNESLLQLIAAAKAIGYQHVRLDTNGQFTHLLESERFRILDEIAFSVDGYDSESNDGLRGTNTFRNSCRNIRRAVSLGVRSTITCCIHRRLLNRNIAGQLGIEQMIRFAESLGVSGINFHDLFKAGVPMDTWTGSFDTSVADHMQMYYEIRNQIEKGGFQIPVRLPQCFVSKEEFKLNPEYYGYCPVKLAERVMVHPNGVIRICSNLICSAFGVGRYFDNTIEWDRTAANETRGHQLGEMTPCTNRSKNKSYGNAVPLCFSFKPNQDEYAWRDLDWDSKRTVSINPPPSDVSVRRRIPRLGVLA
ncbi:MAG: radical SAM protein [Deltaproteobacteria bacterium]|nr:radical SAM protein [Deltaproteobacteria bacterium]